MKYRLLALMMVFIYLCSSVTVFASQLSTSEDTQENKTEESSSINADDSSNENTTDLSEEDTSSISKEETSKDSSLDTTTIGATGVSTIQVPSDGGCIIQLCYTYRVAYAYDCLWSGWLPFC